MKHEKLLLDACDDAALVLQGKYPAPVMMTMRDLPAWRHVERNSLLMAYTKSISALSACHASVTLRENGHIIEMIATCRIARECAEDVLFLLLPKDGGYHELKKSHVEEYFQEELANDGCVIDSQIKRPRVSRKKIQAAISNQVSPPMNPSDSKKSIELVLKMLSGSIHGAYFYAMDIFGGNQEPLKFHVGGISDNNKVMETGWVVSQTIEMVSSSFIGLAKANRENKLANSLEAARDKFNSEGEST